MSTRRRFSGDFKAKVALEALRGDKTIQERQMRSVVFGELERVGVSDMFQTALGDLFATAWWVIPVVLVVVILGLFRGKRRRRWK